MTATPPSDAASLLVPIHLDAWVVDSQSQQAMALYEADFSQLSRLLDPLPAPFYASSTARPLGGVHLHWALPDALTHGGAADVGAQFSFPLVPNRWLIARLGVAVLGTTAGELSGGGVTSFALGAGATEPLAVGMPLQILSPDTQTSAMVVVASSVAQGATQIAIQPCDFATALPAGSSIRRVGPNSALPTPASAPWQCKLWVVQSDYLAPFAQLVGTTASGLNGVGETSVTLASAWGGATIPAGTPLELASSDGSYAAGVVTSAPTNHGDAQVSIQPYTLAAAFPAGSALQFAGSAFLDPSQPTSMTVAAGQTTVTINEATIGASYGVEAWQAQGDPGGQLFLQAVGPGNISFAAYAPFVKNVFSFTDSELPPEDTGVYLFTYLVVGWYSDPATGDPLRGVGMYPQGAAAYVPPLWASQAAWQAQSAAERLQTILGAMQWSIQGDPGASPPSTSLYHGLVAGVQWPYTTLGSPVDGAGVQVAVGNTAVDALAALIQNTATLQAKASPDPQVQAAWYSAGDTLATLIQAAMYDLIDDYGVPGGSVLIEQQIEQAWYGSNPGGTVWDIVSAVPQVAGQAAAPPQLTPAQSAALTSQLAALNERQRAFDQSAQTLQWLQANLYMLWLKYGMAGMHLHWPKAPETNPDWPDLSNEIVNVLYPSLFDQAWDQYCAAGEQQTQLPDPTDAVAANAWANATWTFPAAGGGAATLADLGLALKAGAMPPFWHPNDPVLLIAGLNRAQSHGEDGRYNADGTLTCRLPGQAIDGLAIPGQPALTAQALVGAGLNLNPGAGYTSTPSIPALLQEAFFADPGNAPLMAAAVGADAQIVAQAITELLDPYTGAPAPPGDASWVGQAPPPFAIAAWQQAWTPLFIEWAVDYFPTGAGGQFVPSDWSFDGAHYSWNGTGFDANTLAGYTGRALLTPQTPLLFKSTIASFLQANTTIDSQQLEQLIGTVAGWDLLSQSLSGLTDQLITLVPQPTFPPPAAGAGVPCPRQAGSTPPDIATLIGDQYHSMPMLTSQYVRSFFPVRSGFVQFQKLQVVDAFGQIFGGVVSNPYAGWPLTEQGFQPQLGQGLAPPLPPNGVQLPLGAFQLAPSLIQAARLDLRFLANDGSGQDIAVSSNPNAICGWLLPNHLDGSLAAYDASGALLGELLPLPQPNNWRPCPGPPGDTPPPQQPSEIANAALRAVVASIAAQSPAVFADLLSTIDETLWMVDPLGGRKDQFLSVLIGRPLAVVQAELQLSLLGQPNYNQLWDAMLTGQPGSYQPNYDTGGVEQVAFPVRLGSLDLRDDGLIGYYLPAGDSYATFYAVHTPDQLSTGDSYIKPIVQPAAGSAAALYQGDIAVSCGGASVAATLVLDPRGSVHAYSGILPVASAALPPDDVESFIRQLKVVFRTGPIIADPGTLRTPKPAEDQGVWLWLQAVPGGWEQDQIVDADDIARLPDGQLQLREGWLQLSDLDDA